MNEPSRSAYDKGMATVDLKTDATGRCFISYRRSRLAEIERLVSLFHEHGVPTWQDIKDLAAEPTEEAIKRTLDDPTTGSAVVWLTADVSESPIIKQVEAPRILRRLRNADGFCGVLALANGLDYHDASSVLDMPGSLEDASKAWSLQRVEGDPATDDSLIALTRDILKRRMAAVHLQLDESVPLAIAINAHALATPGFEPGYALAIDWTKHFELRHTSTVVWTERLLPALQRVVEAIRREAPRRRVVAEGHVSISSAFALGRAFMEPSGLRIGWKQLPSGEVWTLSEEPEESGFRAELASQDSGATDLAVLVSVRGDVEPAVKATANELPRFRAILRISPADRHPTSQLNCGKAVHLSRLVGDQIRAARQEFRGLGKIHMFFSGPVGLAMMIGQQFNAIGPVQIYEHEQSDNGVGVYRPGVMLSEAMSKRKDS